ncbi:hypothetical protein KIPB_007038 [Kipferlia bialata]|uniref:Uncharacterized protein n=1 Tax=Kipferlia bialata TaxID=797122 RepID=A0A9K3CZG2_9EUKA|nr:hypothetical protein KIPB_004253 [Kipferlia bialata]GIQ85387.1 hypothetical protein KIPB_007038 [Kipferlia bialata]|eukprot:g4253.t1
MGLQPGGTADGTSVSNPESGSEHTATSTNAAPSVVPIAEHISQSSRSALDSGTESTPEVLAHTLKETRVLGNDLDEIRAMSAAIDAKQNAMGHDLEQLFARSAAADAQQNAMGHRLDELFARTAAIDAQQNAMRDELDEIREWVDAAKAHYQRNGE